MVAGDSTDQHFGLLRPAWFLQYVGFPLSQIIILGEDMTYHPRTGHSRTEIGITIDAIVDKMTHEEVVHLDRIAKQFAMVIPALGVKGARELLYKIRFLLLKSKGLL